MVVRIRTRVTEDGEITVPAAIAAALGLEIGDPVDLEAAADGAAATIRPAQSVVDATFGALKTNRPPFDPVEEKRRIREGMAEQAIQRDLRSQQS